VNLRAWYKKRGSRFVLQRGISLLNRYSLATGKAVHRIEGCLVALSDLGCVPTFFSPAIIVQRNPVFIRHLQEAGAEVAVHGYNHINLGDLPVAEASRQLLRAVHTFERFGIEVCGFRCPYIGCSEELLDTLPIGVFDYSSNQPIFMDVVDNNDMQNRNLVFNTLSKFYKAEDSSKKLCLPWIRSNMLEIPLCVPDDLQLRDGLQLDQAGIAQVWDQILQRTHLRGELFTLIFHTELASFCDNPFSNLIRHARQYQPAVWIARLRDISDWWREKATFRVEITPTPNGMHLSFICSPRATILARGLPIGESGITWDGSLFILRSNMLDVPAVPRPFVGLAPDTPASIVSVLREQGYILDTGETARNCGIYLDEATLPKLTNRLELVNYIEASSAPLVRFWCWPDGAKSALSITGDLDALTLLDYASRLFAR
jgi:hypothetical protein